MIDKQKQNLNMKVQWAKFAVVLALYLLFLVWVESWLRTHCRSFIFELFTSPRRFTGSGGRMKKVLCVSS